MISIPNIRFPHFFNFYTNVKKCYFRGMFYHQVLALMIVATHSLSECNWFSAVWPLKPLISVSMMDFYSFTWWISILSIKCCISWISMTFKATDFCKHDGFLFFQWSGVDRWITPPLQLQVINGRMRGPICFLMPWLVAHMQQW